ncbi:hypothetical protein ACK2M7_12785 [Chryseobacterium sp. TY4]
MKNSSKKNQSKFVEVEYKIKNGKVVLKSIVADGGALTAVVALSKAYHKVNKKARKYIISKNPQTTEEFDDLMEKVTTFDLGLCKIKEGK